jgi:hypothetical protein
MSGEMPTLVLTQTAWIILATLSCAHLLAQPVKSFRGYSQDQHGFAVGAEQTARVETPEKGAAGSTFTVPAGTILPVRLNSTLSSAKSKSGQIISGRVMQDVPLSSGILIKKGSKVVGQIVEVTPPSSGKTARISLQFDKLLSGHHAIPITTNLRAIAGFMRINEAQTPPIGPGESDVYQWLTTVQVGGDIVYGEGGPVTSADDPNDIVGKAVDGGVLSELRAGRTAKCRGATDANDAPQALWVFSADACGTYGLEHIRIISAGRSDGVIAFGSDNEKLKIPGGAGLLLRINKNRD